MTQSLQGIKCQNPSPIIKRKCKRNSKLQADLRAISGSKSHPIAVTFLKSFLPHSFLHPTPAPVPLPCQDTNIHLFSPALPLSYGDCLSSWLYFCLSSFTPLQLSSTKGPLGFNQASWNPFHFLPTISFFSLPILLHLLHKQPERAEVKRSLESEEKVSKQ